MVLCFARHEFLLHFPISGFLPMMFNAFGHSLYKFRTLLLPILNRDKLQRIHRLVSRIRDFDLCCFVALMKFMYTCILVVNVMKLPVSKTSVYMYALHYLFALRSISLLLRNPYVYFHHVGDFLAFCINVKFSICFLYW